MLSHRLTPRLILGVYSAAGSAAPTKWRKVARCSVGYSVEACPADQDKMTALQDRIPFIAIRLHP